MHRQQQLLGNLVLAAKAVRLVKPKIQATDPEVVVEAEAVVLLLVVHVKAEVNPVVVVNLVAVAVDHVVAVAGQIIQQRVISQEVAVEVALKEEGVRQEVEVVRQEVVVALVAAGVVLVAAGVVHVAAEVVLVVAEVVLVVAEVVRVEAEVDPVYHVAAREIAVAEVEVGLEEGAEAGLVRVEVVQQGVEVVLLEAEVGLDLNLVQAPQLQ